MTDAEWMACTDPEPMLKFYWRKGSKRKLRLFAVACSRAVLDWLIDNRSLKAVEIAESFADGQVTKRELRRAESRAEHAENIIIGPHRALLAWQRV